MNDCYEMATARPCPTFPRHVMVNRGRDEAQFADVYRCECGVWRIGNTDELKQRTRLP